MKIKNFTSIDSEYGTFIVNRHCAYQAEVLIKTGRPHIQDELNKILAIVNTLPDKCVAVDAGANIGLVTIPLAQLLTKKNGFIHAFEVQRMMSYALCGAVALNDLENVKVYNKALGSDAGKLKHQSLDYSKPQDFGLFSLTDQTIDTQETVEVLCLDSIDFKRLDFLKIDVEGMEIDVLKGSQALIKKHLPWCWVEYWQVGLEAIKAQFSGLPYVFYKMDELNLLCAPSGRLQEAALDINAKEV